MARISFLGAYCSNHFNCSDADFELRLEVSKAVTPKWHWKDPLTWWWNCLRFPWHISLQTDIPVPEGIGNLTFTNSHFPVCDIFLMVYITICDCFIHRYCRESAVHWKECFVWADPLGSKEVFYTPTASTLISQIYGHRPDLEGMDTRNFETAGRKQSIAGTLSTSSSAR